MAASAKANVAAAGAEINANTAVADSYSAIGQAAASQVLDINAVNAAVLAQQTTVASVAKANVDALIAERDANLLLAASYESISNAAIRGSEKQIVATKMAADAALKAGVVVKVAAAEEAAAFDGVRSHILSLGNVLGVTFGAAIAVSLVKNVVGAAAQVQKSVEAIRSRFGGASESVIRFGEDAAAKLGISADVADATSARFGILFSTLGFGPRAAAQMTLGFEKLAGSIAAIKGVDPTTMMQSMVLAAAGNTRGLKQLGIVVDSTSEKQALFGKNASLITAPLTSAQKTVAIYRIVTRQLGFDMSQVSKHSGDLAFKQRVLSAEFSNAKDSLGKALLPVFAKYTTELADWLQLMEKSGRLQKDFNSIAATAKGVIEGVVGAIKIGVSIWHDFADAVGGAKTAVVILLGAMAVSKFASVVSSIKTTGITLLGVGESALMASAKVGVALGIIDASSIATGLTIKAAIVGTGIGAIIVAIGIATAYIITHWDQVKRWTAALGAAMGQIWTGIKEIIIGSVKLIGGGIGMYLTFPMKEFVDVAASAVGWIPYLGDGVKSAARAVDALYGSMKNLASGGKDQIIQGARDIGGVGQAWTDSMAQSATSPTAKAKAKQAGMDVGQSFNTGLGDAIAGAAGGLTEPLKPVLNQVHNAIESARTKIQQTVSAAKDNLVRIGDDLAKTIERIQAKIGGAAGAIAGSPQGQAFAKLKQLIESGAPSFEIARARAALSSQLQGVGKSQPQIKTDLDNLTAAFNKGEVGYRGFEQRLHKILREDGVTLQQALKAGGPAFADAFKAQVAALGQQASAIAAIPAKYRGIGGAGGAADIKIVRPLQVIQQEQAKIAVAAHRQRDQQIRYAREMAKYQANLLEQTKQEHRARISSAHSAEAKSHGIAGGAVPAGYDPRTYGMAASTRTNPSGYLTDAEAKKIGEKRIRENESYWKQHFAEMRRSQREGMAGPAGPAGPTIAPAVRSHLEGIRAGIVQQTATETGQHKQRLTGLQRISGEIGRLGGRFAAVEEAHVARPLEVLHRDNVRIAATAEHQREALLKAAQRTNVELRALRRPGRTPGFDKYPHGKGSKDARMGAETGSRV